MRVRMKALVGMSTLPADAQPHTGFSYECRAADHISHVAQPRAVTCKGTESKHGKSVVSNCEPCITLNILKQCKHTD